MAQQTFSVVSALLIASILPLIILLVAAELSLKYPLKRKSVGTVLAIIGVLEILGFFMLSLTVEGVTYLIPFSPRMVMVEQGSVTMIGGLVILYYAKPVSRVYVGKSVPPKVERQEIPLRQDASSELEQVDAVDGMVLEAEEQTA